MRKILPLLILLSSSNLLAQSIRNGSVTDKVTHAAIGSAYVQNHSQKRTVVSSLAGLFQINASTGDTLVISCVGYKTRQFIVPESGYSLVIELVQEIKTLEEVLVIGWSESRFKREFLQAEVPPKVIVPIALPPMGIQMGNVGRMGHDYATLAPKMTLKGPISMVYDRFSREAKNRRSVQKQKVVEDRRAQYRMRMDTTWISRVTDLKGVRLDSFMKFCRLEEKFVLSADEYELTVAIRGCLKDFLAMNE
ncbi:carboxypeptidase-like regulatory domain-containing protein [Dyadobacter psychrotolerans]|uniref:Carboxypeptidase-like regulatory domain-containing protein n=1 Tax=Dyadobacter psychrotolerans TaxID=2541721 RepID=A0A4V2Z4L8_9BACT|nr:carboxypeptidase-like regulatory domain-containing protein [Dyadobacter psychrotolerans]TDE17188.1 hypothetical protein E0F88_04630 [Dyadobacter psychrotolerans]